MASPARNIASVAWRFKQFEPEREYGAAKPQKRVVSSPDSLGLVACFRSFAALLTLSNCLNLHLRRLPETDSFHRG